LDERGKNRESRAKILDGVEVLLYPPLKISVVLCVFT
jgi:hypothetical protein